jgi:aminoglycoside phosphotransferase (APT) family kinase protein
VSGNGEEFAVREPLERWLAARLPDARGVRVAQLRRPGTGMSSDTLLFELAWTDAGGAPRSQPCVLRCAPRGTAPFPSYDLGLQFRVMRGLARQSDVPVPEALWLEEDASLLGVPFLVMRAVAGAAPCDFPPYQRADADDVYAKASPATRRRMWRSTVDALARLHAVDWTKLELGRIDGGNPGDDARSDALRYWRDYLLHFVKRDPGEPTPVFDETLAWLEANRPEPERLSLCWGDAKIGNALYDPATGDVAALLDWEMTRIGDPEMDLPSLHFSDLRAQESAGSVLEGTPGARELVAMYEQASGRPYRNFDYQLVFATFWRGSVALAYMRQMEEAGRAISPDYKRRGFPTRKLCELLGLPEPG